MEFAIAPAKTLDGTQRGPEVSPLLTRALHYMRREDYESAESLLKEGLGRSPRDPELLANMAICLAAGRGKLRSGLKLALQALRLSPRHPRANYAVGRINLLGARYDTARRHLERARTLDPLSSDIENALDMLDRKHCEPVISDLPASHPLNVRLGQIRHILRVVRRRRS